MAINFGNFSFCATGVGACVPKTLPAASAQCVCSIVKGRINDYLWVSCTLNPSDADLQDPEWWETQIDAGLVKRMGAKGIGGFKKKSVKTDDLGGCGTDELTGIVWQATWKQYCIDQSVAQYTHDFAEKLLAGANNDYNMFMRPCADTEQLYPVGKVTVVDFDHELPEGKEDNAFISYEFNWKSLLPPKPFTCVGLNTVLAPNK